DDIHWAAKPTLLLLRHLVRSEGEVPLLIVGTYRDTELGRGHPLAEVLADLRREPGVERVALIGLTEGEVGAFVEAAAGQPLDGEPLVAASAVGEDAAYDALEAAERARLIAAVAGRPGRYTFAHALVRSTLYEELSTTRRLRLHRKVAQTIEQRSGAGHVEEL